MNTKIFIALTFTFAIAFAKDKETMPEKGNMHIEMHEKMAKAHQEAAACLQAGKPKEDCQKAFQDTCKESGLHGQCGGMMGNKPKKKY